MSEEQKEFWTLNSENIPFVKGWFYRAFDMQEFMKKLEKDPTFLPSKDFKKWNLRKKDCKYIGIDDETNLFRFIEPDDQIVRLCT